MNENPDSGPKTRVVRLGGLAGESLKHFRIEELIGEGGMGQVYRARDSRLNRSVAIKVLSPELTANPERKQRFLQEARAAAQISHPSIAQIHDVDDQKGTIFIVMELVEGQTVQNLIALRELDILGAIDIALQVAAGLAKAHELGIVHRDIKPGNVMLTRDGQVKILDFGLAKLLDTASDQTTVAQTSSGVVIGTAAYMSPEQARGAPVDHRTDIFSLGALLYEMATGQSPFGRENLVNTLHAVAFEEPPPMTSLRTQVPNELQRIVSRCLCKEVEARYPDARQLARDLRDLRRDTEAGVAGKTSWWNRISDILQQWRRQPPSRYLWFAIGLLGFGFAVYLSLSQIGWGGMVFGALLALFTYRRIRSNPHRMEEWFVRRVAKIPEVRVIAIRDRQATVFVDRHVAPIYGRINRQLAACNRKLLYGPPMTVSIREQVSPDEFRTVLSGPGVHFVRPEADQKD